MLELPLQAIDNVLRQFNLAQILVAVFVLSVLSVVPLKSMKLVGIVVLSFGAIFLMLPLQMAGNTSVFKLVGVGLIVVGPMVFAVAEN